VAVLLVVVGAVVSLSEAKLNPVDAAALFDLCDRPGIDLWPNCSDVDNACINITNWTGITCDYTQSSIVKMYAWFFAVDLHYTHVSIMYQRSIWSTRSWRIASGIDWKDD